MLSAPFWGILTVQFVLLAQQPSSELPSFCKDVKEIAAPGAPGQVAVFGPKAFPIIGGKVQRQLYAPVAAGASLGKGRIVALAHTGYLSAESSAVGQTRQFLINGIQWASQGKNQDKKVRLGNFGSQLKDDLIKAGLEIVSLNGKTWTKQLSSCDVVFLAMGNYSAREVDAVAQFVEAGGGLITVETPWGWLQLHPGKSLQDHPAQSFLTKAGLAWADGTVDRTTAKGFATQTPLL